MKLKHDLEINTANPFSNCRLGREKYAKALTNIVENYPDGFVLAINNKWGSGKTTFVKMWEQELKNLDYKTIYFNAWENDFEGNPLVAMLAEIKVINPNEEEGFNKVMKNAAKISKNIIPSIAISFLKKYIDSETILNGLKDTSNTVIEIFEDDINDYSKRKKSIEDFKNSLSKFVAEESNGRQLIFIIDELDRCRPSYSVQLLEQIKHFFSIPNIIFVLSIDKIQLENAVCGVYGSEKIDANEYLKRFIDLEYSIPEPDKGIYFHYLYDYFQFNEFFRSGREVYTDYKNDEKDFKFACQTLLGELTLRQQEKILSHLRLTLRTLNSNEFILPPALVFLIFIKNNYAKYYVNISNKSLSILEMHEEFYAIIKSKINEETSRLFSLIEAYLLVLYENYLNENYIKKPIIIDYNDNTKNYELIIDSKIDNNQLLHLLQPYRKSDWLHLNLAYFINHLDLTQEIIINR